MRQVKSTSFEFFEPDQLGQADVLENLISLTRNNRLKAGSETWACAWAPDNSFFAWSSGYRILHLIPWDNDKQKRHEPSDEKGLKGRKYHILDCAENICALAFGSGYSQEEPSTSYRHFRFDKNLIVATGLASGRIKLWNCHTGTLIIELLDHRDSVRCLDFTKNGSLQLLSASRDGSLKLWDLNNEGNMYSTYKASNATFYSCRFSPNGRYIAAVGSSKMVCLWSNQTMKTLPYKLSGHYNQVVSCDFSPDSSLLATASYDTKVIIWDVLTMKNLRILGHLHPSPSLIFAGGANDHFVRGVSFSRDGFTLSTVCDDGYVRFWSIMQKGDPRFIASVDDALCCKFSSSGSVLAVGFRNGDVKFFTAPTKVPSLLQLSRQVIHKHLNSGNIDVLPIPKMLIDFLHYYDFFQDDSRID